MLSLGQKVLAFASLLFISLVSFVFSPLLTFVLVPFSVVIGLALWRL